MKYSELSKKELQAEYEKVKADYEAVLTKGLSLDMSRGKPSGEQLDPIEKLLSVITENEECYDGATDCRNYGLLDGVTAAKELFAPLLGVSPSEVIVCGNSSLNVMHDTIVRSLLLGVPYVNEPWCKQKIKFLCPSPGYDRHFAICEQYGIDMVVVPMTPSGPDMDMVEKLIKEDASIKGIWCTPKYSNPDGITYSDETVKRFANLKPAAKDFRIFWDNAYCIHDIYEKGDTLLNLFEECKKAGSEDMVYMFASTSKITYPGAGVAIFAASQHNLVELKKQLGIELISYDKLNQLRHVKFFKNTGNIYKIMQEHAKILRPKFDAVLSALEKDLGPCGIAHWTKPKGGYFISLFIDNGGARRTIELASKAGVKVTPAGSTYPYHNDPYDSNIRLAPSYPTLGELKEAIDVIIVCAKLAALEKLI